MPNTVLGGSAMCPFFMSDVDTPKKYTIVCEGVYGTHTTLTFKSMGEKYIHANTFCMTKNCRNCEIYRLNLKKYET